MVISFFFTDLHPLKPNPGYASGCENIPLVWCIYGKPVTSFVCAVTSGIVCFLIGIAVIVLDVMASETLMEFFNVDITQDLEEFVISKYTDANLTAWFPILCVSCSVGKIPSEILWLPYETPPNNYLLPVQFSWESFRNKPTCSLRRAAVQVCFWTPTKLNVISCILTVERFVPKGLKYAPSGSKTDQILVLLGTISRTGNICFISA